MSDAFPVTSITRSSFGTDARVLTASASDLDPPAKSVVLLTAGDITIVPLRAGAPSLPFVGLPAGYIIPFVVRQVTALANGATCAAIDA